MSANVNTGAFPSLPTGYIAPTIAMQTMTIGSGAIQGLSGFWLANQLSTKEKVPVSSMLIATGLMTVAQIWAFNYLAKKSV